MASRWPLAFILLAACSSSEENPGPTELPGPAEWNRDVTPPSDADAEAARQACTYQAGALPAETQGASHPNGAEIPVDHVVIVMMENRSFDHYFQRLPEYGQPDVDVAPETFTNPDPDGVPVGLHHETDYCFVDTAHGYQSTADQIAGGAMTGFITTNEGNHEQPAGGTLEMLSGTRALGYYDETDIPFYYWLANEFSLGDRYFSSVAGPTWPNRMYLFGATSWGQGRNNIVEADTVLMDNLEARGVSWKLYASTTATLGMILNKFVAAQSNDHIATIDEYFTDVANGTLPQVAFVEPGVAREAWDANDEHPPAIMQLGQSFVAEVTQALMTSPHWSRSALFLTYDEHGGVYDHVAPPEACPPDDLAVPLSNGTVPSFDRYGVRVPFVVVSPFAKKHHVSHRVYDHTSIVRFVEARFVLPAMTGRDANAEAPWDMFDFEGAPHATPPTFELPPVDQDVVARCEAIFEP